MNNRIIGVIFCFISSFLFATNYICASILSINFPWEMSKQLIGKNLIILSVLSLIIGIIYLIDPKFKKNK